MWSKYIIQIAIEVIKIDLSYLIIIKFKVSKIYLVKVINNKK